MPKSKTKPPDIDVFDLDRLAALKRPPEARDAAPAAPVRPQPAPALVRPFAALPHAALLEEHDAGLAELVRAATAATSAAQLAALDLEQAGERRPGHAAALAAEREHALAALQATGEVPGDPAGPLLVFLTETRPALAVAAARTVARAEWCAGRVRTCPRTGPEGKLTRKLDRAADDVEEQMGAGFARAEEGKDRAEYEVTRKLGRRWAELAALHLWCLAPGVAYTPYPEASFPRSLAWAEYMADTATGGPQRAIVPLEPKDQATIDRLNAGEALGPEDNPRRRRGLPSAS
jgi:hypothetical protein